MTEPPAPSLAETLTAATREVESWHPAKRAAMRAAVAEFMTKTDGLRACDKPWLCDEAQTCVGRCRT